MPRTFWPNRISQRFVAKNRSTGLNFTPISENSRLSMKIVQNVRFRQCGGRFGQIAFLNVPEPTIALLDWNSRQYVKTVGFLWKLYKTCFSRYADFGQIAFFNVSDQKSPNGLANTLGFLFVKTCFSDPFWPNVLIALPDWNSRQYVKTVGFLWKLYKTCFSRYAEDVLAKLHLSTF